MLSCYLRLAITPGWKDHDASKDNISSANPSHLSMRVLLEMHTQFQFAMSNDYFTNHAWISLCFVWVANHSVGSVLSYVSCVAVFVKEGGTESLEVEGRSQETIIGRVVSSLSESVEPKPLNKSSWVSATTDNSRDLVDIEELKRKLEETENAMTNIIARMSQIVPKPQVSS